MTDVTQAIPAPGIVLAVAAVVAAAGPVALLVALWERGWRPVRTALRMVRRR